MTGRAAVFLDRDGVLNERPAEHEYVTSPADVRWLPGAVEAAAGLSRAGYPLVVVSNQRGIARRMLSWEALRDIEDSMRADLENAGARVDGFYYCPHDLEERCACRKPAPGLLLQAAAEHNFDLRSSIMIGDTEDDVRAGSAAGCVTIRIGGSGTSSAADLVLPDLQAAATAVLAGTIRTRDVVEREQAYHDRRASRLREAEPMPPQPADEFDRAVLSAIGDVAGLRVLDVGCGEGGLTLHLSDRGAEVTALDLSSVTVDLARRRVERFRPRAAVTFVAAPAENTGLPDASFDVVVGKLVLHHIDLDRALPELRRVLKPSGVGCFLETSARNRLLLWARDHLVGRAGIARYGTPDEHPLTPVDVRRVIAAFGEGEADYPLMYLARLLDSHIALLRWRPLTDVLSLFDAWAGGRPRLQPLSYYVRIVVRRV